jgi:enoyl-CoA hydratase/carnithine racemase
VEIEVGDDGAVRILALNRPARLNAFTASAYREFTEALAAASADENVTVVVLVGNGPAFCAGADVKALADERTDTVEMGAAFGATLDELMSFPKPLIAAVHGAAVGFGFTLLLHCDIVLVAEDARLRAPFTMLQTAPEAGSSWLLPRAIGLQRAAELLLTSRWITAAEAVDFGLASRVCAPHALRDEALQLAHSIAQHGPAPTQAAKRLLRHGRADHVRAAMARELDETRRLSQTGSPLWGRRD